MHCLRKCEGKKSTLQLTTFKHKTGSPDFLWSPVGQTGYLLPWLKNVSNWASVLHEIMLKYSIYPLKNKMKSI